MRPQAQFKPLILRNIAAGNEELGIKQLPRKSFRIDTVQKGVALTLFNLNHYRDIIITPGNKQINAKAVPTL